MSPRPPPADAVTALRRFGLGPRPGDLARVAGDPRGYALQSIANPGAASLPASPDLPATPRLLADFEDMRIMRAVARTFGSPQVQAAGGGAGARRIVLAEAAARIGRAVATDTPLVERLVYFWSNHFTVAIRKGRVRVLAGAFEREAIRPFVLGRFGDMLKAVAQHPAMLIYLDNTASIGPGSRAGLRQAAAGKNRGLNENLAREILELHTLGVDGGYTQADVTSFARILTGWSVAQGADAAPDQMGRFEFAENRHEPGSAVVMGRTYGQSGVAAGETVLADLSRHKATGRHIARKLARHFVSDTPPPALVERLERAFVETGGDLTAVTRALLTAPEAWSAPPAKIVPPYDFIVSLQRGFAMDVPPAEVMRLSQVLGQQLWNAPSPKGWPDDDDAWISPSPIRERLRIAEMVARRAGSRDPRETLRDFSGEAASETTRTAVQRAESREQAIELMIMSPEFMRR